MKEKIIVMSSIIFLILIILIIAIVNKYEYSKINKTIYAMNENSILLKDSNYKRIDNGTELVDEYFDNRKIGIKYTIKKGIVSNGVLCFKKNTVYCLKTAKKSNYEENLSILRKVFLEKECDFSDDEFNCYYSNYKVTLKNDGGIDSCEGDSPQDCDDSNSCTLNVDGETSCHIW